MFNNKLINGSFKEQPTVLVKTLTTICVTPRYSLIWNNRENLDHGTFYLIKEYPFSININQVKRNGDSPSKLVNKVSGFVDFNQRNQISFNKVRSDQYCDL